MFFFVKDNFKTELGYAKHRGSKRGGKKQRRDVWNFRHLAAVQINW